MNPTAGRGRVLPLLERALHALKAAGAPAEVTTTGSPGEAAAVVAALPPDVTAVAVGGDGTVHAVMRACLAHDRRLGVLPSGSGDDFAFALGLGRHDLDQAVRVLLAGRERRVDVGEVNGEPFVNGFGSGFDADVADRVLRAPHAFRGLGRYLYGIVTALRDFRLAEAELTMTAPDGDIVRHTGPTLLVSVQNGPRAGGSFNFAPGAALDDGIFDVLVAGRFGRMGTLAILPRVMRGTHLGHPRVHRFAATSVDLRWSTMMAGHAEGEQLDPSATYRVRMRPLALRILAP